MFVAANKNVEAPVTPTKSGRRSARTVSNSSCMGNLDDSFDESDFILPTPHARRLVRAAKRTLPITPPLVTATDLPAIPSLSRDEIKVGPLLGVGGFGFVQAVEAASSESFTKQDRMVCKTLVPHTSPAQLLNGCHHLETEKQTLKQLNHPNIIRLRGYSDDGLDIIANTKRIDSCFLLLDYLPETLADRIETWRHRKEDETKQTRVKIWKRTPKINKDLFKEQLQVAIDIAAALKYLHEKRIILRDLKPDNVGFDEQGQLKLFDFGLVAHLPADCDLDATHALPGKVGTPRYMATEVLREERYNHKADVFSFTLVVWEMLMQEKPLDRESSAIYGERPDLPKYWPEPLRRILTRGWSDNLSERPCMTEFKYALEDVVRQL